MACSDQDHCLFSEATKPHFFKVVLDDTIRDRKLGIPRKFLMKYGNNLPSSVVVKVPSGENWQIKMLKCDGEIWLKDGWQEFVEFYSITHGSFLVFEYDLKNCHFNVVIFDKSATEIDYPCGVKCDNLEEPNNLEKAEVEFMLSRKIKEESPSPLTKPCRKMKQDNPTISRTRKKRKLDNPTSNSEAKVHSLTNVEKNVLPTISHTRKKRKLGNPASKSEARAHSLRNAEKTVLLNRTSEAFQTKNPSFMIVMQPAYLHSGGTGGVYIPIIFARKYLIKESNQCDVILKLADGRTWIIRCGASTHRGRTRPLFMTGWPKFSCDNLLEVGNVCVFELINSAKNILKVTIFRYKKAYLGNMKELQHEEESGGCKKFIKVPSIRDAERFTSKNPFFKLVVNSSNLTRCPMYVPSKFMAEHTKQITEKVTLKMKNKQWYVKLISCGNARRGVLSGGLTIFVRENSLRAGDVCIFELINDETMVFKVYIYRNRN